MHNRLIAVMMLAGLLLVVGSVYVIALPFDSHVGPTPTISGTKSRVSCGSALDPLAKGRGVTARERARACANGLTTRRLSGFALALMGLTTVVMSARALSPVEQNKKRRQELPTPTNQS
jgi:hypothetical protein